MTTSRQHCPIGSTRIEGFPRSVDMVEASVAPRQRLHEGGDTRGRRRCRLQPRQEQAFTRHGRSHPTDQLIHPSFPLPTGRAASIHWHRSHLRDQRQQHQPSRQREAHTTSTTAPPQHLHRTNRRCRKDPDRPPTPRGRPAPPDPAKHHPRHATTACQREGSSLRRPQPAPPAAAGQQIWRSRSSPQRPRRASPPRSPSRR